MLIALLHSYFKRLSVPITVFEILCGIGLLTCLHLIYSAPLSATDLVNCNIQRGACVRELEGGKLTLDILPRPVKAMQDLVFRLTLSGIKPTASPHIDLGMPGMDMGPNRVRLKTVDSGVYEGTGIIVRCPSGRKVWRAKVTIPDIGAVDFIFNVIY
jgi:hypothetical protein